MDVAYKLDCDWQQRTRAKVADVLARWQKRQPQLRPFSSPRELLAFLHSAPGAETDGPLLALVSLARDERLTRQDRLAGRTLLQVLLPALKTQAERIAYPAYLHDEVWEVLLYFAWEAISLYPLERRRTCVATKLYFDVLHRATRELHHKPEASEGHEHDWLLASHPIDDSQTSSTDNNSLEPIAPAEASPPEVVVLNGIEAGALAPRDAELILLTRVDRIPLSLLAPTFGVSYHALRQRRQRAEARLREVMKFGCDVSKRPILTLVSYEGAISPVDRARSLTLIARDAHASRAA
jgi:hypothetical protein